MHAKPQTILILLLLIPFAAAAFEPASYLPSSTTTATVGVPRLPEQLEELVDRMQQAVLENQDWFFTYALMNGDDVLPYHPNFGLTPIEYATMLALTRDGPVLHRDHTTPLRISHTGEASLVEFMIDSGPVLLQFHRDGSQVTANGVALGTWTVVNDTAGRSYLGRWEGRMWTGTDPENTDRTISVSLGRGQREYFIRYSVVSDDDTTEHVVVVLYSTVQS